MEGYTIKRNIPYGDVNSHKEVIYNTGSGGTRYHVATQKLRTAGFLIKLDDFYMYVDPGTSALISSLENRIPINKINTIFVSHAHVDHYGDLEALIESIYLHKSKSNDTVLLCGKCVVGCGGEQSKISKYHKSLLKNIHPLSPGKKVVVNNISITTTPTLHHEHHNIGFVIETRNLRIGYVSDSSYFDDFSKYFRGVDVLIAHPVLVKSSKQSKYRHASYDDVKEMIMAANPELVVLRHIGYEVLMYGVERFAKEMEKEVNSRVEYLLDRDALIINP